MENYVSCDSCLYEVPESDLVDGLCSLCYEEGFGEYDRVEKFHRTPKRKEPHDPDPE